MTIPENDWVRYISRLSRISKKAAELMQEYIDKHGTENRRELISYAYELSATYGEAAASLTCEMYDALSGAQGAGVRSAEMVETVTERETAKAILGTMKNKDNSVPQTVGRLVKQAGADTALKNALRDGAEFAWVPHGDTCPFCIMLASRGWQKMSKAALKGGHAEHIHANCDCTFAVRFDGKSSVEGYEPEKYREIYDNAEGNTPEEKLNSMRREAAERERMYSHNPNSVSIQALDAPDFVEKFDGITGAKAVDDALYESAKAILTDCNGTNYEHLYLIDAETGDYIHRLTTSTQIDGVTYDEATHAAIEEAHRNGRKIIAIHNHPNGLPPTLDDGSSALAHGYDLGIVVGHNLEVWTYGKSDEIYPKDVCKFVHAEITKILQFDVEFDDSIWYNKLIEYGMEVVRK